MHGTHCEQHTGIGTATTARNISECAKSARRRGGATSVGVSGRVVGRRPSGTPQRAWQQGRWRWQGAFPRYRAKTGGAQRGGCGARMCERGAEGVSGPRRRTARQSDRGSAGAKPPLSLSPVMNALGYSSGYVVYMCMCMWCGGEGVPRGCNTRSRGGRVLRRVDEEVDGPLGHAAGPAARGAHVARRHGHDRALRASVRAACAAARTVAVGGL